MTTERIRDSVIAGTWYSGDPETLRREIRKWLEKAGGAHPEGEPAGLIVPHAGYMYSGAVAGHAYKLLERRRFERVLIVAPSHRARFQGSSIYNLGGYRTPLGVVPLDTEIIDALFKSTPSVKYVPHADSQEHSLEIQLPFLQVVLKDFRLTPVIMGDQSFEHCMELADAIASVCRGKDVLLVASSDLSHYHSDRRAKLLDSVVIDRVAAFDPAALAQDISQGKCEACGAGPMIAVMLAAKKMGVGKAKVLHYANSGSVTGDTGEVVGYMAAVLYHDAGTRQDSNDKDSGRNDSSKAGKVGVDLGLSPDEKAELRDIAFRAIRSRCLGETMDNVPSSSAKLDEPRGAFVTLHKEGNLRGCIGLIEGRGPLRETVKNMAIQAAFSDPRFPALKPDELDRIDLEISVLTPLVRIDNPESIEIGRHGLLIRKGYHSGLLLPQVATENHWDRKQFLDWTCRKAGLQPGAWLDADTEVYTFSADIF